MPLTVVPTVVPISPPGLKSHRPVVASEAFTIDCADCTYRGTDGMRRLRGLVHRRPPARGCRRGRRRRGPGRPPARGGRSRPRCPALATGGLNPVVSRTQIAPEQGPSIMPPLPRRWCVSRSAVSDSLDQYRGSVPTRVRAGIVELSEALVDLGRRAGLCGGGCHHRRCVRRNPHGPGRAEASRARRGHAVHLPEPRQVHRSRPDPSRGQALVVGAWSYRHEEPPTVKVRFRPAARAGRVARYARRITTPPSGRRWR